MEINPANLIEDQRVEVRLLEVDPLMNDPLFVAGMLSGQVGILSTIGCNAEITKKANMMAVVTCIARISAIAQEALEVLAAEVSRSPKIIIPPKKGIV